MQGTGFINHEQLEQDLQPSPFGKLEDMENPEPLSDSIKSMLIGLAFSSSSLSIR
jgi:hypothetical protein